MEIKRLVQELNSRLPEDSRALLGGSVVLKAHGLLTRVIGDVDIIVAHNIHDKNDRATYFDTVQKVLKDLFPFEDLGQNLSETVNYNGSIKSNNFEKYKFNFSIFTPVYFVGDIIHRVNIIVHENIVNEDYYSVSSFDGIPCCSLGRILAAKVYYGRPKDHCDFTEIQYNMFHKKHGNLAPQN